jgi:type IV pilus assembly protein PilF
VSIEAEELHLKAINMLNWVVKFFLLIGFLLLSACQTTTSNDTLEDKKVTAAKINVSLAMEYLKRQDMQRAKQKLLLALEQAPKIPEPYYTMAYFLEATGNNAQAEKFYLKAIALAPGKGDVHNNYGTFLCRQQHYKASIQHFMQAAQDPKYLESGAAYENAGLCAEKIPDDSAAIQYLSKSLEEDSNRALPHIELAEIYYRKGNLKFARAELLRFLQLSPVTEQAETLAAKLDINIS